jgi:hypothetical protein
MSACEQFLWGFAGSVAVEIVTIFHILQQAERELTLPIRYRAPFYWFVRVALAAVGGGLAVAYDIDSRILAANIGAATPAIIVALTRGPRLEATAPPSAVPVGEAAKGRVSAAR